MLKSFNSTRDRASQRLLALMSLLPGLALAELPTMEAPSRGEGGGVIQTIQNYSYDAGILVGLVISLLAFLGVAWYSFAVYAEVQGGRKTWKDLGAVTLVGAVLVVAIIWLLTKASTIL